jgi:hypothetical protein
VIFAIGLELAVACVLSMLFIVLYMNSHWVQSPMRRHIMALAGINALEPFLLLLVIFGVQVPIWLFLVTFGLIDLVMAQRLWLLWRPDTAKEEQ